MPRRTLTIEKYTLPSGVTDARVSVKFTLVDSTSHRAVDGYRADDNEGVVGVLEVRLSDAETTIDLTPNEEIADQTLWKTEVVYKGTILRRAYVGLPTGGALTFPEFLALDTDVGHWTPSGGAISSTVLDALGDIIVASGADTPSKLPVGADDYVLTADSNEALGIKWAAVGGAPEGTSILSTGEAGGAKYLREDGDGTSSWQDVPVVTTEGTSILSTGEAGATKYLREDGDGTSSWQDIPSTTTEGTAILSTGEAGGTKVLTEDGDGTSSWQDISSTTTEGTAILSTGEAGGTKFLREDGDGTSSWQAVPSGDLVDDTTPQLGGNLDTNEFALMSTVADGATAVAHTLDTDTELVVDGANLLEVSNNGTEKFAITKGGALSLIGAPYGYSLSPHTGALELYQFGSAAILSMHLSNQDIFFNAASNRVQFTQNWHFLWSTSTTNPNAVSQLTLGQHDGDYGALSQKNGTDAMAFRVYNTWTDASNFERAVIDWQETADTVTIGSQAAGTGTLRGVEIVGASITLDAPVIQNELSADPADPSEGSSVMWQSDGTGSGDDGDIMMKITAGGSTKTATLVDFSAI